MKVLIKYFIFSLKSDECIVSAVEFFFQWNVLDTIGDLRIRECSSNLYAGFTHAAAPTPYKAFMAFSTNCLHEHTI